MKLKAILPIESQNNLNLIDLIPEMIG